MRSPFDSSAVRTLIFASVALYGVSRGVSNLTGPGATPAPEEPARDYLAEVQGRMRPEAKLSPVQIRHLQALSAAEAAEAAKSPAIHANPSEPSPSSPQAITTNDDQWPEILELADQQNATTSKLEGLLKTFGSPRR
ncbi:MAG: hypothetical protein AAFZ65_07190 [Planctomycetota bacterium]